MITEKAIIREIPTKKDGKLKRITKKDMRFMAQRAKAMGDKYKSILQASLQNESNKALLGDEGAVYTALMGLTIEIYLKYVLYDRAKKCEYILGHSFYDLFSQWPSTMRKAAYIKAMSLGYKEEEFNSIISSLSNTFTTQRYNYELFAFSDLFLEIRNLLDIISEIVEMYECDNNLNKWNLTNYRREVIE